MDKQKLEEARQLAMSMTSHPVAFGTIEHTEKAGELLAELVKANEALAREAHTWSKAAETYAADAESLRAEVKALRELWDEAETENDSLRVETPTPALRRAAERSIVAWTVVRGGVWDPNGLMDEHMDALRKALGPNATMKPLDPLDVEEMWDQANADERADEVHHAFARLVERAHGIGPNAIWAER